jgi:hypothetical protein
MDIWDVFRDVQGSVFVILTQNIPLKSVLVDCDDPRDFCRCVGGGDLGKTVSTASTYHHHKAINHSRHLQTVEYRKHHR